MIDMHALERNWWEALADQYEEWAENPPRDYLGSEEYTCSALEDSGFGWRLPLPPNPADYLRLLWFWQYGGTLYPAGFDFDPDRPDQRFEFCWWMAETIRDYLETGRGPWE